MISGRPDTRDERPGFIMGLQQAQSGLRAFIISEDDKLAKPNYQYEKRQKDLARRKKQEEKRQRKQNKGDAPRQEGPAPPPGEANTTVD